MSVTVTKAEEVTVFTVTSNPKSKWPLFFQIMGTLCCSPVCFVSQKLKEHLGRALIALATAQIMIGLLNLGIGGLFTGPYAFMYHYYSVQCAPFWLGGMFLAVGIMSILTEKFPSPCLVVLTVMMNLVSAALAITAIVLYSWDIVEGNSFDWCNQDERRYDRYYWQTTTPAMPQLGREKYKLNCEKYKQVYQVLHVGLHVMMIFFAALQLCITISWCVLNVKALCKIKRDGLDVEDPEDHKALLKQEISNPEN